MTEQTTGQAAERAPDQALVPPVELRGVTTRYGEGERAVTALDNVTLNFAHGTMTAVMGPSGSGKSTLLHCAAGIERPTRGEVLVAGTELGRLDENALTLLRRERVGFVFQAFNLVSALTAAQNVELPLRLAGRRAESGEVIAALERFGLGERAGHRLSELSGGQQQRVALARAVITRPAVLFADEPTGALDTHTSRGVLRLLRELVDVHSQTVVMVTHDPAAAAYADRVVLLADGRPVSELSGSEGAEAIAAKMAALEGAAQDRAAPVPEATSASLRSGGRGTVRA
ncbi:MULTISPECIES: ABC transporter ATP-binding protein [unclassified Streptomyces]|uniref:ABC transporter ATP-binding protein n=1 Tax=unclassified Streptomyces TaxID=2593676 RepID=UPI002DD8E58E|nr:ABC transporter ATP-binding protein [Streptomyces sp. NBC_01775]WSB79837.1 ABC transporter ATP-binding protein [Streptomyces sp. NBC_01775]WSS40670.1 ABC transporter ATP-binding protein [Streptomyces sp. NBC_01187]